MKVRSFRLLVLCAFVGVVLSGCATMGNKKLDDVGNYLGLQEQRSTKLDVYNIFGQPHDVRSLEPGNNVWVYYKVHTRPSAWTYVPFLGIAAGGSARDSTFSYFNFDEAGTLRKIESKKVSDYENMWIGAGHALSRISDKAQAQRVRAEMDKVGRPFDEKLAKSVAAFRDE